MIRLIGTRIIIPKGDTGVFTLQRKENNSELVRFFVQDPLTKKYVIEKDCSIVEDQIFIEINHEDTKDLRAGKYFWDIKDYYMPVYDEDGILIDAQEINSYYSAFKHPVFVIKEIAENE